MRFPSWRWDIDSFLPSFINSSNLPATLYFRSPRLGSRYSLLAAPWRFSTIVASLRSAFCRSNSASLMIPAASADSSAIMTLCVIPVSRVHLYSITGHQAGPGSCLMQFLADYHACARSNDPYPFGLNLSMTFSALRQGIMPRENKSRIHQRCGDDPHSVSSRSRACLKLHRGPCSMTTSVSRSLNVYRARLSSLAAGAL